ncbi:hypothetical protein G3480_00535 [Thiorhodococcus mannitoliphagus]|uniref:Uncharacterized protein n=1 Tax=Thiorhodococcus mannitoliphagus TaxID=329406 RepID=A0A6P1DLM4_9GAMM|nr:hypothetical protein [Thiorhodococcus mannitoliphagus]NEX18819.1 hypothetical protein [Thiorhodococcus mannitoliphagus]
MREPDLDFTDNDFSLPAQGRLAQGRLAAARNMGRRCAEVLADRLAPGSPSSYRTRLQAGLQGSHSSMP